MFYDQTAIDYLIDRIGWAEAIPPSSIAVSVENSKSTSGRFFDEFFKMSVVENIEAAILNSKANATTLNDYLLKMKKEAVMNMLDKVFDSNERANYKYGLGGCRIDISGVDYSAIIPTKGRLFDAAIGYSMALSVLELLITTTRENAENRNNKFDLNYLLAQLEGIKNENGHIVSKGMLSIFHAEIERIIDILFPKLKGRVLMARNVW